MPPKTRKKSKTSEVTVVKRALKSRIQGSPKHVHRFIDTLSEWVVTISKIYREGSLLFNLHLLRMLDHQVDPFTLPDPKLFPLSKPPRVKPSTASVSTATPTVGRKKNKRSRQAKIKCAHKGCSNKRTVKVLAEFGGYCSVHKELWPDFATYVPPPKPPPSAQTHFRNVFKAVTMNTPPKSLDPELKITLNECKDVITKVKTPNGITQSINYIAQAYQTNVLNHIAENLFLWQRKAIKALIAEQTRDSTVTDRAVSTLPDAELKKLAWTFAEHLNALHPPSQVADYRYTLVYKVLHYRAGHVTSSPIDKIWVKSDYNRSLLYVYQFLRVLSRAGHKCFSIAPIADVKAHHIMIDQIVLYYILCDHDRKTDGVVELPAIENFDAGDWWDVVFRLGGKAKRVDFRGSVRTDGVSMSIHYDNPLFKKPVKLTEDEVAQRKQMDQTRMQTARRVIGLDPGRTTLLHAVDVLPTGEVKQYKLTKKQYYHESHITRRKALTDRWLAPLKPYYDCLSLCTTKTPSYPQFKEYVSSWKYVQAEIWEEMLKKRHARGRLDVYAHKRKSLDKYFDSFMTAGEVEPVIAYGDAGFSSSAKGEISAPTISLFKRCRNHYVTCLVDEYNTTKMCNTCGRELKPLCSPSRMVIMNGKAYKPSNILPRNASGRSILFDEIRPEPPPGTKLERYTIRGLRRCESPGCRELIDRDANAALNIRDAGRLAVRPGSLRRPS